MTVYEALRLYLRSMLSVYRYLPAEAEQRKTIDRFMEISRKSAEILPENKPLYNLLVLEFIVQKRPPTYRICEALGISRDAAVYQKSVDKAIDLLLILVFGIDGVNWEDQADGKDVTA